MVNYTNGIYYVSGKIDKGASDQFKEELKNAFHTESVIIDFGDVEYISSAGLRVILSLQKSGTNITVTNVRSEVYEIFEVTGFTELFKVEKKLREVSVDGCDVIGRGGTGTVYKVSEDMIVKVYNPGMPLEVIEAEKKFAKKAFVLGIPTAIPFDVVKVGDCYGTCFELLNAVSLGKALQLYPERYDELVDKYVDLIRMIQTIEDKQGVFESIKDVLLSRSASLRGFLPDDVLDTVDELTSCMPESDTLVHGDLHTGNVMLQNDELVIIDMADVTRGPKNYDMLCLYRDYYHMCINPQGKDMAAKLIDMPAEMGIRIWYDLVKRVYGIDDEAKIQKIMDTFAQLTEVNTIPMSSLMPRAFLENVKDYILAEYNATVPGNIRQIKEGFAAL